MRNERGLAVNWAIKLVLALAIGGVILYDAITITINFFGLDSAANDVANRVTTDIATGAIPESDLRVVKQCVKSPNVNALCTALHDEAKKEDARLVKSNIDQQGDLKIRLRRTAKTLVVDKISFIKDWGVATVEGSADTQPQ